MPVRSIWLAALAAPIIACGGPQRVEPPQATHGVMASPLDSTSTVIWSRADRPGVMRVRVTADGLRVEGRATAVADDDSTARAVVAGLRPGTDYEYQVWFDGGPGEPAAIDKPPVARGRFRTPAAPDDSRPIHFVWSGDLAGQNICRDAQRGFPMIDVIRDRVAADGLDFFLGLGDMIYADDPCRANGSFGNDQIPGPEEPAVALEEFWAYWRYNREDADFQALLGEHTYLSVFDDHETLDDAGPEHDMRDEPPYEAGEHLLPVALAAYVDYHAVPAVDGGRFYRQLGWGRHLDLFFLDTRQYRDANSRADSDSAPKSMLGQEQRDWLVRALSESETTWRVVVSSVPLSLATGSEVEGRDGWADADTEGGFERELLELLGRLRDAGVRNTIWLTTDVHLASGFRYQPFPESPDFVFWEFSAGPLSAALGYRDSWDETLRPENLFLYGAAPEVELDTYDAALAYFNAGFVTIEHTGRLTVEIVNALGEVVETVTLVPSHGAVSTRLNPPAR